jgi:S-adenosylmethionine decarboxylase
VSTGPIGTGREWIVDATGCRPASLRDLALLRALFADVVRELGLTPAAEPLWKVFPEPGGVTGMALLTESHLTVHTFPEHGVAAFNLYCCTPRAAWRWDPRLREVLGAAAISVRTLPRGGRGGDVGAGGVR